MYYEGKGITQDYKKAFELFSKAANQGYDYAQYALGLMYYNGYSIQQDYQKAIRLFSKAADQGNENAIELLAKLPNQSTTLDLDKCIQGVKDELINSDDRILDIDITVDATKEQINFSVVVDDTTAPEASLDIGDTVIKRLNNYARGQDTTVKPHDTNYYGGLYDTYAIVIGVSPLSEVSNIDNWYVYDYIEQDVQGYVPLKLQKPYR